MSPIMSRLLRVVLPALTLLLFAAAPRTVGEHSRPNIVLIMTDDQGYGDIAAHGHPKLRTPHMDRLREQSVRLENFHVDPTCSPSRSALMTGQYSARVGVWHTLMGRNMLREDAVTVAQMLGEAGYRTAIFGKWHLGDNYPYGAKWRGFDDAIVHFGGGVGQTPDFWGNDYFDDHYFDNGAWAPFQGYCTDVWFREALRFIQAHRNEPFFVYLPTNAAHQTRSHVPERYAALYADAEVPEQVKRFWAMITNIDDNLGVLLDRLRRWGLEENTILIFMGDNGTTMFPHWWPEDGRPADFAERYNAGMRGQKGSHYDGGHRVHAFIRHPARGIQGGRDVRPMTAHIDLAPTLLELAGVKPPVRVAFDGTSLVPLLTDPRAETTWPDRTLIVHNQRVPDPIKWRQTAVMTDRWRLVDDRELYDMGVDPGQQHNVIDEHPEVAGRLRAAYERWWTDVSTRFQETTPLYIGAGQQEHVQLNAHDWMADRTEEVPWNQPLVVQRMETNGPWRVRAVRAGRYRFVLRERPKVAGFELPARQARLRVGEAFDETRSVEPGATGVRFEVDLPAGDAEIRTWLVDADGTSRGAYYVDVTYLGSGQRASRSHRPASSRRSSPAYSDRSVVERARSRSRSIPLAGPAQAASAVLRRPAYSSDWNPRRRAHHDHGEDAHGAGDTSLGRPWGQSPARASRRSPRWRSTRGANTIAGDDWKTEGKRRTLRQAG
jgi:arylsulfatase A-like enzyme